MRSVPAIVFVTGAALAPLVWGACSEPLPPASPDGSPTATDSSATGPATDSPSTTAAEPPVTPSQTAVASPPETTSPALAAAAGPGEVERLVAALPKKGAVRTVAQCKALIPPTNDAMGAAQARSAACAADADCEVISGGICLQASCGVSVAKAARATYEADRKRITDVACGAWSGGGCEQKVPLPSPSCALPIPVCKGGQCATRW